MSKKSMSKKFKKSKKVQANKFISLPFAKIAPLNSLNILPVQRIMFWRINKFFFDDFYRLISFISFME